MADLNSYVTIVEAAEMLGVDRSQVNRYILGYGQVQLPAQKVGNQWLIKASDIRSFRKATVGNPNFKK